MYFRYNLEEGETIEKIIFAFSLWADGLAERTIEALLTLRALLGVGSGEFE
jgi:hypothetical protein